MVAAAYSARNICAINYDTFDKFNTFIRTYDLSGTEAGRHCAVKGRIIEPIWTHEKCIRFVTFNPGSVVVSEVEFTLKNPPVEVESLPIADKIVDGDRFLFLPALCRLAFTLKDTIQVWDAKAAKLLLKSKLLSFNTYPANLSIGSFSSDGRFFAHADKNGVARVWKESPAGYVLHQKLPFVTPGLSPRLSPSGESIFISPDCKAFHLWHTRDQIAPLPSISAGYLYENNFTLAFSPDERFAAFARRGGKVVTIFNLLTSNLQLTVNIDAGVLCLGMTGSALIVVGKGEIVTWDLPGGDWAPNISINDLSVRTTRFDCSPGTPTRGSISPDFRLIAVLIEKPLKFNVETHLQIYEISTGRRLTRASATYARWVGFTWDGREVWTTSQGWKIVEGSRSGITRLKPLDGKVCPLEVFPWGSRCGYEVTGDGWVLSATRKRLLWLPRHWRSHASRRMWNGRFLALFQSELSEIVILEFPE